MAITKIAKTVIDENNYDNVHQLLCSNSEEDKVVGLQAMENCDFSKSVSAILMLYKTTEISPSIWKENAPSVTKKIAALGFKMGENITYNKIMITLGKNKYPIEQINFFLSKFGSHIKSHCIEWGYDFVKDVEIKIIMKDEK